MLTEPQKKKEDKTHIEKLIFWKAGLPLWYPPQQQGAALAQQTALSGAVSLHTALQALTASFVISDVRLYLARAGALVI